MKENVCSASRVCIVDGRKFLDTMRCEHMCFSIILKEGKRGSRRGACRSCRFVERVSRYCLR